MKRVAATALLLLNLSVLASTQTLKHFPVAPQYTDRKVLIHLESLENQLKAVRKSTFKVSFYGWSNPDVGAAAEKTWGTASTLMEGTISRIEDIRAAGSYSIGSLFQVYTTASNINGNAVSLAYGVSMFKKKDAELYAEILGDSNDLALSLLDIENDISFVLNLEGDMLLTLESIPSCKVKVTEQ
jgi:hypothetical protein